MTAEAQAPRSAGAARYRDAHWHPQWIVPQWPAPPGVHALITTRAGGVSSGPFGTVEGPGGLNLSFGPAPPTGEGADDALAVTRNRERLCLGLPRAPCWLHQVHGVRIVDAAGNGSGAARTEAPQADGAFAVVLQVVCCVLVADCLPVLLADVRGRGVAAAHAGWRGLAGGVIQNAVEALRQGIGDRQARILAYLGPAIGPAHFLVGREVLAQMSTRLPQAGAAFEPVGAAQYRADLFALARQALAQVQVDDVFGGGLCTVSDPARFYSYRRDRVTGRHAALIWLGSKAGSGLPETA